MYCLKSDFYVPDPNLSPTLALVQLNSNMNTREDRDTN